MNRVKKNLQIFLGNITLLKKSKDFFNNESISNKLIILECQRASEYYRYLELKTKAYTYKELFEELHNFYCNTRLTLEELKLIPKRYNKRY